ncbi:MAG: flagellar basal body rod protein FlgF [Pseudomonadota bacterium]|nr:flagellar basal body rod protein FlgF [Pseudomonadota bacterium]
MDRGLYVAMSGAGELMRAQAVHANNLANVNTVGFRADLAQSRAMPVFADALPSRAYAMTERPAVNQDTGVLVETGRPLDVAVAGDGWIAVLARDGSEAYTRAGDLQIDAFGMLTTATGQPVLGNAGPIAVPPSERIEMGADGTISVVPLGQPASGIAEIDRIKLVNPPATSLQKGVDGLLRLAGGAPSEADAQVQLRSGFLEGSNVNAVNAMTEVISLARQFEMQVKLMKTFEDNAAQAARILQLRG